MADRITHSQVPLLLTAVNLLWLILTVILANRRLLKFHHNV